MNKVKFKSLLVSFLIMVSVFVGAQNKGIIISESLAANSEPLKVKIGTQWMGKIRNFEFGEYSVVQSKIGWIKTSNKSNLFNTKSESKTTQKFSFTLCNKTGDSVSVNAANSIEIKVLKETELFSDFYIGDNEILLDSSNFTALININRDTTETWTLFMNSTSGSLTEELRIAFLTNGNIKINLVPVSSNIGKGVLARMFPAQGFEFFENDLAIGALQYFGGGATGTNKNIVWILNDLKPEIKLVLAAAMTAILQLQN